MFPWNELLFHTFSPSTQRQGPFDLTIILQIGGKLKRYITNYLAFLRHWVVEKCWKNSQKHNRHKWVIFLPASCLRGSKVLWWMGEHICQAHPRERFFSACTHKKKWRLLAITNWKTNKSRRRSAVMQLMPSIAHQNMNLTIGDHCPWWNALSAEWGD